MVYENKVYLFAHTLSNRLVSEKFSHMGNISQTLHLFPGEFFWRGVEISFLHGTPGNASLGGTDIHMVIAFHIKVTSIYAFDPSTAFEASYVTSKLPSPKSHNKIGLRVGTVPIKVASYTELTDNPLYPYHSITLEHHPPLGHLRYYQYYQGGGEKYFIPCSQYCGRGRR